MREKRTLERFELKVRARIEGELARDGREEPPRRKRIGDDCGLNPSKGNLLVV